MDYSNSAPATWNNLQRKISLKNLEVKTEVEATVNSTEWSYMCLSMLFAHFSFLNTSMFVFSLAGLLLVKKLASGGFYLVK